MTVRDWLESRSSDAPRQLTERMVAALGADGVTHADRTAHVCARAAARILEGLVTDARFGRDSALDLLTADALMTHAFEYASERTMSEVEVVASESARLLIPLTAQRV